jgi:hypothetical protein
MHRPTGDVEQRVDLGDGAIDAQRAPISPQCRTKRERVGERSMAVTLDLTVISVKTEIDERH